MSATDHETEKFTPPYVSFTTFTNFLDRLGEGPIPPRIDKHYLDNLSGSTQAALLAALRTLNLIDEHGSVSRTLREMATDQDARKQHLHDLLVIYYPEQLALAEQNGTAGQLLESFQKWEISGSTIRKAIIFYLNAVEAAGAPNSEHFKAPRASAGGGTRRRRRTTRKNERDPEDDQSEEQTESSPASSVESVDLRSGGTVTVSVSVDLFNLDVEDRQFVFQLIDLVKGYRNGGSHNPFQWDTDDEEVDA